jgi:DNA-binding transcriptional ArsR family regulator
MTISGPRVRDYTDTERRITVDVVHGEAFETVLALFVYAAACDDPAERAEYEVGDSWFEAIAERIDEPTRDAVRRSSCCGELWLGLIGVALDTPEPRRAADLLALLETMDPAELRRRVMSVVLGHGMVDPDVLERAAAGDPEVLADLPEERREKLAPLVAMDPAETHEMVVTAVTAFADAAHADWRRINDVLARDAEHKQALARTMAPDRLVEMATKGITFAMQPDVSGVVLIPSVVQRPWVTITEHGSLRVFSYPVADEHMEADPDAPPTWLVDFYKALGDERRLRLLGVLAEGPATLAELTERVELAKSTVHHHMRVLRTAGLVRVTVGDEKEYSLRTDATPEASRLLEVYLGTKRGGSR